MMIRQNLALAAVLAGLALAGVVRAETDQQPAVDAVAMRALDDMGAYLRNLKSFSLQADDTFDTLLDSGQKIQLSAHINLAVRKPDRLRANIVTDLRTLQMFYNGKEFTLYAPKVKYYATVPAAPTIKQWLAVVEERFGIAFPLVDLFRWGEDAEAAAAIKEALVIGPSNLAGQMTDHYAFRQDGLDWQIWIAQGAAPLPLKYVITTLDEPSQPQYTVRLTWDTAATPDETDFTFQPAADHYRIAIVTRDEAGTAQ